MTDYRTPSPADVDMRLPAFDPLDEVIRARALHLRATMTDQAFRLLAAEMNRYLDPEAGMPTPFEAQMRVLHQKGRTAGSGL